VAVTLIAILHAIPDSDDPHAIVTSLLDAVPPGSYLALAVCDRLYVLSGGRVVRENRCADVDPEGRALIDAYLG